MIVFRAWDYDYQEMIYPDNQGVFSSKHRGQFVISGNGNAFCLCKNFDMKGIKIIQSTGYDDSEGQDIYDGDIVDSALTYLVFYDFDGATFRVSYGGAISDLMYILDSSFKPSVIGNKYENPELLNEIMKGVNN